MINVYADGDVMDFLGDNWEEYEEAPNKKDMVFEIIDYSPRKGIVKYKEDGSSEISVFRRYDYKCINSLQARGTASNMELTPDPEYADQQDDLIWFASSVDVTNNFFFTNHLLDDYNALGENEGVLIELKDGDLVTSVVKGENRPDLLCMTVTGKQVMARPYKDEAKDEMQEEAVHECKGTGSAKEEDLHFFMEARVKDVLAEAGETKLVRGDSLSFDITNNPLRCYLRSEGDETTFNVCVRQNVGVSNDNPSLSRIVHWGDTPTTESKSYSRISNDDSGLLRKLMFAACKLNSLIKERDLLNRFAGINPDKQGIYVEYLEGDYIFTLVEGEDRPDLACQAFLGKLVWARPYQDEMWEEFQKQQEED